MIDIRRLSESDAGTVYYFLKDQPAGYLDYFHPFEFDVVTLRENLRRAVHDLYMGIFLYDTLIGVFLIRGWDEGYFIPSFGIAIGHMHQGYGISQIAISYSKAVCKLKGSQVLMLKVHPENTRAFKLFRREGFVSVDTSPAGLTVMHFSFSPTRLQDLSRDVDTIRSEIRERFGMDVTEEYAKMLANFVDDLQYVPRD
jgi:hypothetical protein